MNDVLLWVGFLIFIFIMLALDLGVFHRKAHTIKLREALLWSAFWITLGLTFNVLVYFWRGPEVGLEFLTGYILEKSLSVDNLFVFLLVFTYFGVPAIYQHKVLFWGILGALVMRGLFIAGGITLINGFHWLIYVFGAFLIFTGLKMIQGKAEEVHPEKNPVVRFLRRFLPVTSDYEGSHFFVKKTGRYFATPLLIVIVAVETMDILFAMDSIPAVLAVTLDPFIVYTSNVLAILGLRALYFALSGVMQSLKHLHYGLSGVLVFVGVKMLIADYYKIPIAIALSVVGITLLATVTASLAESPKGKLET